MKQLPVPFNSIMSNIFASFAHMIPPRFILFPVSLLSFLYVDVIVFTKRYLYSSLFNRYESGVSSAGVVVLFVQAYSGAGF